MALLRADLLLVQQALAPSRTAAQRLIAEGRVTLCVGASRRGISRSAETLPADAVLEVASDPADRFVSRGGLKLAGALATAGVAVEGAVCLDVGQSTGGFTDCLLQAGAARVIGVEVGHGQLHPKLINDPRVICHERINARTLAASDLGAAFPADGFDLIVADASFISLTLLLPRWPALLAPTGAVLALVKPQFEVGPEGIGKGGLVRSADWYPRVEAKLRAACADAGLAVQSYFDSPILGGDGNREFFIHACLGACRTFGGEGENELKRGQLREDLRHVAGLHNESRNENGPVAAHLQPAHRKSDRLLKH